MPGDIVVREVLSAARAAAKISEGLVKKPWSIMDAASEKLQPSEYLSQQAIRSIQGKDPGTS